MENMKSTKPFDLEERTRQFAQEVIEFTSIVPKTIANVETLKQLVRASGSVGANYIEARESLSKIDFAMRMKICRKEVKESRYWLSLIQIQNNISEERRATLASEVTELLKIFSSMIEKTKWNF
jgi:four helix bundle protein